MKPPDYNPEHEFVVDGTNWIDEDRANATVEIFASKVDGPEVVISTDLNPYTKASRPQSVAVDTSTARVIAYTILEAANYLDKQQTPAGLARATLTPQTPPKKPARPVPQYIEQWFYDITPVADLPLPDDLESPLCMSGGITAATRTWRQLRPHTKPRTCCWFHAGDWHQASHHARTLVENLYLPPSTGDEDDDPFEIVRDRLRGAGLSGWMHEAVHSLICGGEPINIGSTEDWQDPDQEPCYVGGRHRALAMMQQGVKKTITMRLELFEPGTT